MYVVGTVGVEKRALPQGLDLFVYTMVISIAKAKIQTKQNVTLTFANFLINNLLANRLHPGNEVSYTDFIVAPLIIIGQLHKDRLDSLVCLKLLRSLCLKLIM